jgi:hypothetical protein
MSTTAQSKSSSRRLVNLLGVPRSWNLKNLARRMRDEQATSEVVLVATTHEWPCCLPRLSGEETADCVLFFTTPTSTLGRGPRVETRAMLRRALMDDACRTARVSEPARAGDLGGGPRGTGRRGRRSSSRPPCSRSRYHRRPAQGFPFSENSRMRAEHTEGCSQRTGGRSHLRDRGWGLGSGD